MRREHERKGCLRVSWGGGVEQDIPSDRSQAASKREQDGLKFHDPRMGRRAAGVLMCQVYFGSLDHKS